MIWLLYILIDSLANWYWIVKKKKVPNYLVLFLIRGTVAVGCLLLNTDPFWVWLGKVALPFPFMFNTLLNTWRKLPVECLGQESGWIDDWVTDKGLEKPYFFLILILFVVAIKYLY